MQLTKNETQWIVTPDTIAEESILEAFMPNLHKIVPELLSWLNNMVMNDYDAMKYLVDQATKNKESDV